MNLKFDPLCYKCRNDGEIFGNTFAEYVVCPVCKNNKVIRIAKNFTYRIVLKAFGFLYDTLSNINWVSEEMLEFHRLHNKNIKARVAKKIVFDYASGYAVEEEKVLSALEALFGKQSQDYFTLAKKSHFNAFQTNEIEKDFAETLRKF